MHEHATHDENLRRKLDAAIAATMPDPDSVVQKLRSAIQAYAEDDETCGYRESEGLADEVEDIRRAIAEDVLPRDPRVAAELLTAFVRMGDGLLGRCDASGGQIGAVFEEALTDLGRAWAGVPGRDPAALAIELAIELALGDQQGAHDRAIPALAAALGDDGLRLAEDLVRARLADGNTAAADAERAYRWRQLNGLLQDIADARGDVDAYVAAVLQEPGAEG